MSEPNERQVEKLLKLVGARRRDQAGAQEMHPAVREVLRTEVHRQYGSSPRERWSGFRWLTGWLPKLAVFLALGLCAWLIWFYHGEEGPMRLASDEKALPSASADKDVQPAPLRQSVPRDGPVLARGAKTEAEGMARLAPAPAAQAPSPEPAAAKPAGTPSPGEFPKGSSKSVVGSEYFKADREGMYMGTATLESKSAEPVARGAEETFARLLSASSPSKGAEPRDKSAPAPDSLQSVVLPTFTLFNEGDVVRLVDQDGSVYEGTVQPGTTLVPISSSPLTDAALVAGGATAIDARASGSHSGDLVLRSYSLTASGTNRSLGQLIRLSGNLTLTEPQAVSGRNVFSNTLGPSMGQTMDTRSLNEVQPGIGRLQGVAVLPNGQDVRVDAVPASP